MCALYILYKCRNEMSSELLYVLCEQKCNECTQMHNNKRTQMSVKFMKSIVCKILYLEVFYFPLSLPMLKSQIISAFRNFQWTLYIWNYEYVSFTQGVLFMQDFC